MRYLRPIFAALAMLAFCAGCENNGGIPLRPSMNATPTAAPTASAAATASPAAQTT